MKKIIDDSVSVARRQRDAMHRLATHLADVAALQLRLADGKFDDDDDHQDDHDQDEFASHLQSADDDDDDDEDVGNAAGARLGPLGALLRALGGSRASVEQSDAETARASLRASVARRAELARMADELAALRDAHTRAHAARRAAQLWRKQHAEWRAQVERRVLQLRQARANHNTTKLGAHRVSRTIIRKFFFMIFVLLKILEFDLILDFEFLSINFI